MRRLLLLTLFCLFAGHAAADWGPAQFLVGRWTGEGSGQPGSGTGAFSFAPDLEGRILVRKSFAEYPPAGGKPAFRHDDLTVIYRDDGASGALRAVYFDNEGHVIHYSVASNGDAVVFLSDGPAAGPRYRLTYTPNGPDRVKIKFEVAAPGKDFQTYVEAGARRD